ncbi:MAG: hypothetical protein LBC18_07975 [Opitutaceae bacterium]|jgi:hypothetical protein|nr:hypothetical protein [Opitutaceae bacterium]
MPAASTPWPAELLAHHRCRLRARISRHDHARHNLLVAQAAAPLDGAADAALALDGSRWSVSVNANPLATRDARFGAFDIELRFRCDHGPLPQAVVAAEIDIDGWSPDNYVLLPSAAYNGNRFPARRLRYSPKLCEVQDIGPDRPPIITDIPKLNETPGPSRIQERSGSMAAPSIGFYAPAHKRALWLLAPHANALGDHGLGIEENRDRTRATLTLTAPLMRELHSYRGCDARATSTDRPADFKTGDEISLRFHLHLFAAPGLQALFDRYAEIRKTAPAAPIPRSAFPVPHFRLPYSAALDTIAEKYNTLNYVPEHGYYAVGFREGFLQDWQIGWVGGLVSTYPLLFAGDAATRARVLRNFDWLFPAGICPAGFFWDACRNGTEWLGGDIRKPHTRDWHLIRKSGDGVYYAIKQLRLMEKLGIPVKPAWRDGVRRVCDALDLLWRRNGQFGQFVDSRTGAIVVGGSTSGAIIPAALTLAARYYDEPRLLETALAAATHYHENFTRKGLACGGPGDALQNPDSESWYSLIETCAALHDATRDPAWLARAAETSRQFSTWVVSYDYPLPPASTLGRAGIRTTGAVYANTQNKHAAPGLCTFSGLAFLKLYRATRDPYHLALLRDIAANITQYVPHPAHPIGGRRPGCMCERVNITDWEGEDRIGELVTSTNWAETSVMLTAIEIPGIYLEIDRARVTTFDAVTARITGRRPDRLTLEVTNPTTVSAQVRLLAETDAQAAGPLQENHLLDAPALPLPPGATRSVDIDL